MTPPRVTVVAKARFKNLVLRYRDPETGREQTRSAGTTNRREAERAAARWEAELAANPLSLPTGQMPWDSFVELYDREHLGSLRESSAYRAVLVLNQFEQFAKPRRIGQVTPIMITRWASQLRAGGTAEATIASYLKQLRAALSWAVSQDLLQTVPRFPTVQRARTGAQVKRMKGRPITRAEFLRMLRVTPLVVGDDRAAAWRRYLRGLWLSGLRLAESLDFWWDRPDRLSLDFSGRRPMFRVHASQEKGGRDRLLPLTPDFARFLEKTPLADRTGPVFPIPRSKAPGELPSRDWVSHVVSAIGEKAGVVVDERTGKFASAHDFRRSFGDRWAPLVMPQTLMELMRHEDISVTMTYYAVRNAQAAAEVIWSTWESQQSQKAQKAQEARKTPHKTQRGDISGDTSNRTRSSTG